MVAHSINLPNIRKMFLPDPGYILIDVDLERADAQVVAWEAGDEELKDLFRTGADVHTNNAMAAFQLPKEQITYYKRQQAKQAVHGFNYGGSAKTIAAETGMSITESTLFGERWFARHPKITDWHTKTEQLLKERKPIRNAFGYENIYFDRYSPKQLHEALAWLPQSSVAVVTNMGLVNIHKNLPEVQPLIQVHDSLLLQVPEERLAELTTAITQAMSIKVPYTDPLFIPTSFGLSGLSWGNLVPLTTIQPILTSTNLDLQELALEFKLEIDTLKMVLTNRAFYEKVA